MTFELTPEEIDKARHEIIMKSKNAPYSTAFMTELVVAGAKAQLEKLAEETDEKLSDNV